MKTFLDAIYTKFVASTTLYNSVGGRMFFEEAPQDIEHPYIIYDLISWVLDRTLEKKYPICRIQFTIISDTSSGIEAQNIFGYLDAVFGNDDLLLTISSVYQLIRIDLESCYVERISGSELGERNVWMIPVDYIAYLEEL